MIIIPKINDLDPKISNLNSVEISNTYESLLINHIEKINIIRKEKIINCILFFDNSNTLYHIFFFIFILFFHI